MRILEFEKLVAVLARVTRTVKSFFMYKGGAQGARDGGGQPALKDLAEDRR